MSPARRSPDAGFTLLEVLVAFAILSIAIVTMIELCSQGLRLLKVSGDHQQAVLLADRIARETDVPADDDTKKDDAKTETVDTGEEGNFTWERHITRLELPEELEPKQPLPGQELPGLYTVSVSVRWGRNQSVEVATLRAASNTSETPTVDQTAQQGQTQSQSGVGTPATPRTPGQAGSATSTNPFSSRPSTATP